MNERTTPASEGGMLRTGQTKIASVLDRVGQEGFAEQVRSANLDGIDSEIGRRVQQLEDQVRRRPITTVALGILAGFFAGRILRD